MGRTLAVATALLALAVPAAWGAARGQVADTCGGVLSGLRIPCYAVDVVGRDVHAVLLPKGYENPIAAYEASWIHRALAFQYELAGDVPFANAPWLGTHNSFNSIAEMGPTLSDLDSNQQVSLTDQLRLDMRSLELDLHTFPSLRAGLKRTTVVCHSEGAVGCSIEKLLAPVLDEIAGWLRAHPNQVLLLYLEDQLEAGTGHDEAAGIIRNHLGDLLYAPDTPDGSCEELPLDLTRNAVRAAGAQVVIASDCGQGTAWHGVAFDWGRAHVETRPVGFDGASCGPDYDRATYASKIVRYFEDSTFLTAGTSLLGAASEDDGLTPATTAAMVRCGVDLFGFDQLLPGDGRLAAAVWSWAPDEPKAGGGACAVQRGADGRWVASPCTGPTHRPACRTASGGWTVPATPVAEADAVPACEGAGARFDLPRTGYDNAQLQAAAGGGDAVWLDLAGA